MLLAAADKTSLADVRQALACRPNLDVVGTVRDCRTARFETSPSFDVAIVDVDDDDEGDRMALATSLARQHGVEVILLCGSERHGLAAFELDAVDYLLKPARPERLARAIDRACSRLAARLDFERPRPVATLRVPDVKDGQEVQVDEIIEIRAARDYALVRTARRTHIMRTTMSQLERSLPAGFLRVHRSSFVALSHVRCWRRAGGGPCRLRLSDGSEVAVGPSYLDRVRHALRTLDII